METYKHRSVGQMLKSMNREGGKTWGALGFVSKEEHRRLRTSLTLANLALENNRGNKRKDSRFRKLSFAIETASIVREDQIYNPA